MNEDDKTLDDIRVLIDQVDRDLVALLNRRAQLSLEVRDRKINLPETRWFAPEREREVFQRLESALEQEGGRCRRLRSTRSIERFCRRPALSRER